jgi:hypothetical protein
MQEHYVALMREAYPAWAGIEAASGATVFTKVP